MTFLDNVTVVRSLDLEPFSETNKAFYKHMTFLDNVIVLNLFNNKKIRLCTSKINKNISYKQCKFQNPRHIQIRLIKKYKDYSWVKLCNIN